MEEVEQLKEENARLKEKFIIYEKQIHDLEEEKGGILYRLSEKEHLISKLTREHESLIRMFGQ